MEGLELLQELQTKRSELIEKKESMKSDLKKRLFDLFNTIKEGDLEFYETEPSISLPWSLSHEQDTFEVRLEIQFKETNPNRLAQGYKRDFGSDIQLYIYDSAIEMNYGTCGQYSKKDKGQITRAYLVPQLWNNEEVICGICKEVLDMNVIKELNEVSAKIYQIEDDIKRAQRERENLEVLKQIKQAKYICKRRKDSKYEEDENGFYKKVGEVYKYWDYEEIKKVTDKSLLTVEDGWYGNHRRDLNQIISDIKYGCKVLRNDKIKEEPVPEEGEGPIND